MKFESWKEHINTIANQLNSKVKIVKGPSMGSRFDYFLSKIFIEYKSNEIILEQGFGRSDYENGTPGKLNISYKFQNRQKINIRINERDFFDKLFNINRIRTGNIEFDKKYTIVSNNRNKAKKVFNKKEFQELLLKKRTLIMHISTKDELTTIHLKDFRRRIYLLQECELLIRYFKTIIENLLD